MRIIVKAGTEAREYNRALAHGGVETKQALSSLDVIDAKASGLGAISGLIFAGNIVLLEPSATSPLTATWINLACLAVLMVAVAICCSCLWILSPGSERAKALIGAEDDDSAAKWLLDVYCARVTRYRVAFWLTLAALAGMGLALALDAGSRIVS